MCVGSLALALLWRASWPVVRARVRVRVRVRGRVSEPPVQEEDGERDGPVEVLELAHGRVVLRVGLPKVQRRGLGLGFGLAQHT